MVSNSFSELNSYKQIDVFQILIFFQQKMLVTIQIFFQPSKSWSFFQLFLNSSKLLNTLLSFSQISKVVKTSWRFSWFARAFEKLSALLRTINKLRKPLSAVFDLLKLKQRLFFSTISRMVRLLSALWTYKRF